MIGESDEIESVTWPNVGASHDLGGVMATSWHSETSLVPHSTTTAPQPDVRAVSLSTTLPTVQPAMSSSDISHVRSHAGPTTSATTMVALDTTTTPTVSYNNVNMSLSNDSNIGHQSQGNCIFSTPFAAKLVDLEENVPLQSSSPSYVCYLVTAAISVAATLVCQVIAFCVYKIKCSK